MKRNLAIITLACMKPQETEGVAGVRGHRQASAGVRGIGRCQGSLGGLVMAGGGYTPMKAACCLISFYYS